MPSSPQTTAPRPGREWFPAHHQELNASFRTVVGYLQPAVLPRPVLAVKSRRSCAAAGACDGWKTVPEEPLQGKSEKITPEKN